MRITLLSIGSRGDVQPFVALGRGLQHAGHTVTLVAPTDFEALAAGHGLKFAPIRLHMRSLARSEVGRAWTGSGQNPAEALRQAIRAIRILSTQTQADAPDACRDAEAMIYSSTAAIMAGYHIAEALGVPAYQASLQPLFNPTGAFPNPLLPALSAGGWGDAWPVQSYNWLTHIANQQIAWQPIRRQTNRWRREVLGLAPLPLAGPYDRIAAAQVPFLHAYSTAVVPRPPDWPPWVHVTGYWFLPAPGGWQPPAALLDFLAAGPPPVAIGFGSMSGDDLESTVAILVAALKRARVRGVLLTEWATMGAAPVPDDLFVLDAIPHDWLFPRVAAVVHHGGAGTTAAALRAGVPSVVVPFFADQFFWARHMDALGAAPPPVPRKRLSPERLAAGIRRAVEHGEIRSRATELGRRIEAEDGVARAIAAFHHHLGRSRR